MHKAEVRAGAQDVVELCKRLRASTVNSYAELSEEAEEYYDCATTSS